MRGDLDRRTRVWWGEGGKVGSWCREKVKKAFPPFSLFLGFGMELARTHDQFVYCTHEVKGVA